ncbi:MAG: bifunctional oligoribonuclease/PAP phosphatase NrnA [Deltaproteobacteria bacterium]|nr:bifunctional oligoribonuclease/PAP phosphatase NrnA [Deltaproteobacteria bacterium]
MRADILKAIDENEHFLITAHCNPDGDALASTLALGNALREMGKKVVMYNVDPVPAKLAFLPGADAVVRDLGENRFDVGFVLDCGDLRRIGNEDLPSRCRFVVDIDHHGEGHAFGDCRLIDPGASATGALVYRVLRQCPSYRFSTDVAICIYTAVYSDTGAFHFSNSDREAFAIAAEMVALGIQPARVASSLETCEASELRLLCRILKTLKISEDGRVASLVVSLRDMAETGTSPEHTETFIDYPRSIRGVDVALLFRQQAERQYKIRMRSRHVNVGALAHALGGGGHANASGVMLEGTLEEVEKKVHATLEKLSAV